MAVLAWGKGKMETCISTNGEPSGNWKEIDTPKEGTLKLTPTAGQETEAKEEGGEIVDSRTLKATYQLEFDLFDKKGSERPWVDEDGKISGEHSFRYTPEDEEATGFLIDCATVRCEYNFSATDGGILHYVAKCLKPKTGKTVKPYVKGS